MKREVMPQLETDSVDALFAKVSRFEAVMALFSLHCWTGLDSENIKQT